jgi:N-acetylmuramoyl-L-alanine amidase
MGSSPFPRGCAELIAFPSPNFSDRRGGVLPSLIVIHYTAMASCAEARARLCAPEHEVSAHWLVSETGQAEALVPEALRAWHAGAGAWAGITDVNSHSIGIELANTGSQPFPEPQMAALEDLLRGIMARWQIAPQGVIGHSDMAPLRKSDPGARFDWRRLARQGLSIWPEGRGDASRDLANSLDVIGYPAAPYAARLAAFRLRFRPWAQGAESAEDRACADAVARVGSSAV